MSSRKRKFRGRRSTSDTPHDSHTAHHEPDPTLFIQAYEADLIHGVQAKMAAASLEVANVGGKQFENGSQNVADGLIRWGDAKFGLQKNPKYGSINIIDDAEVEQNDTDTEIWVDRYDARLLLDTLPTPESLPIIHNRATSPSGWSDLPSDAEDTFFMDPDEIEAYQRDKRRRILDRDREERLKALQDLDGEEIWGGRDEEPDEVQKEFMRRTAKHIVSSPNPAQLEMRILANHGSDKRFAFLRGRWKLAWQMIKSRAKIEKAQEDANLADQKAGGLGGLSGYGDSDEEGSESGPHTTAADNTDLGEAEKKDEKKDEEALKEARRLKAKEWAQKRRESKTT